MTVSAESKHSTNPFHKPNHRNHEGIHKRSPATALKFNKDPFMDTTNDLRSSTLYTRARTRTQWVECLAVVCRPARRARANVHDAMLPARRTRTVVEGTRALVAVQMPRHNHVHLGVQEVPLECIAQMFGDLEMLVVPRIILGFGAVERTVQEDHHPRRGCTVDGGQIIHYPRVLHRTRREVVLGRQDGEMHETVVERVPEEAVAARAALYTHTTPHPELI